MIEPTENQLALDSVWQSICTIAGQMGVVPLNKLPGLWVFEAKPWKLTVNPHRETIEDVEPFRVQVEWNGVPAGIISAYNAEFVHHENANIRLLAEALKEQAEAGVLKQ